MGRVRAKEGSDPPDFSFLAAAIEDAFSELNAHFITDMREPARSSLGHPVQRPHSLRRFFKVSLQLF